MSAPVKPAGGSVAVRAYRAADAARVLELLAGAFGRWPGEIEVSPSEFFHWKHEAGAFGPSRLLVAELEGVVVGFAGYMPWRLRVGSRTLMAARAVDLVVDPSHRRLGASVAIRTAANAELAGHAAFVWGNPNEQAHPGGRSTGASDAARIPYLVRPGRQWRKTLGRALTRGSRTPEGRPIDAESAAELLGKGDRLDDLLQASRLVPARLATDRDADYLRWRYGRFEEYRGVGLDSAAGLRGIAIFRPRRYGPLWGADVCELIVQDGDRQGARRLLRQLRRAASADFLSCASTAPASEASCGFLPSRRGTTLTTLPLEAGLHPDPAGRQAWALSRGDLELL